MKSVIIIGDGMSDRPVKALDGRTPLMVANTPNFDRIARHGRTGRFKTIPDGQPHGSAIANLSILGYDPAMCFQGRGVLEAASMGVELDPSDVAMRCNFITVEDGRIKDHSAGHLTTGEAHELIATLDAELGSSGHPRPVTFYRGVSYRNLLVLKGGWASARLTCAPPHDHVGERVVDLMPRANEQEAESTAARLAELYEKAETILASHPVNVARQNAGKEVASTIWPWSPGNKPSMQTLEERFGIRGAVISAVDLVNGLGHYAGLTRIHVEGATGLSDTNYEGKADACLSALHEHDLVYVHVEASDEAGHARDLDLKIKCIEYLDRRLVKRIVDSLEAGKSPYRVALLPDHPTPVELGSHADDPVPVAIMGQGIEPDNIDTYDETQAAKGALPFLEGDAFIKLVLGV